MNELETQKQACKEKQLKIKKCKKNNCIWSGKNIFGCDNYSEDYRVCKKSNFKKHYEEK